jgi:hypothetical protein
MHVFPQPYMTVTDFGYLVLALSFCLFPKTFKLFGFPIFDFEHTWRWLFQKRVAPCALSYRYLRFYIILVRYPCGKETLPNHL